MKLKYSFILLIALLNNQISLSQTKTEIFKHISIESNLGYGFVMPHHKSIEYCVEDHIKNFDIRIAKQTTGEKPWHKEYRYPRYGIGYYHSNLGNDIIFGNANAFYSFVNIPFFEKKIFSLNYQISIGMSFISEPFDLESNYKNIAIGSSANIYLDFSIQPKIKINNKFSISSNFRFTHFSNGKIVSPNKGLNLASNSLGISYSFGNSEKILIKTNTFIPKNKFTVIYSGGIKTISRYEKGNFFASSITGDFYRQYKRKYQWSVGTDIFFDSAIKTSKNLEEYSSIENSELFQYGVHIGHDMVMGQTTFTIQLGGYVYTPIKPKAPIYNRIGVRYYFKNNLIANLTLKSHYGIASFVEFGMGYCFN